MKAFIVATFFVITAMTASSQGDEFKSGSARIDGSKIDLAGKLPEDFDWPAYFARSDQSTGGRAMVALSAQVVSSHTALLEMKTNANKHAFNGGQRPNLNSGFPHSSG